MMRMPKVFSLGQIPAAPARPVRTATDWWNHHIMNTRAYAETSLAGNASGALEALMELWEAVLEWQALTGSRAAGVLMAEHTALVKMLVDGLAQGEPWSEAAAAALQKNAEAHRTLFPRRAGEFTDLFAEHTAIAGQYIADLGEKDFEEFQRNFSRAIENGRMLADLTAATF